MTSAADSSAGRRQVVIATAAGAIVGTLGLVVLVGWHTHTVGLIQVLPVFVPMQYNTALSFLLSGIGLVALVHHRPRLTVVLGSVVGAIGFLTLIEYIFGVQLGVDQLFFEAYITVETSHPGRMAPNTAVAFSLTAGALFTSTLSKHVDRRFWLTGSLGAIILALGSVAFLGYLTGAQTAFAWGQLTRMAVHTSAGFVMLASGILALAFREGVVWGSSSGAFTPDKLVRDRRRIVTASVAIMALASVAVGLTVIRELYSTGLDSQRARLEELVLTQTRMIEAVARFDEQESQDVPGGARAATLSQVLAAHEQFPGFGETGEFTIAKRAGDEIVFLVRPPHAGPDFVARVGIGEARAEPMQRALGGEAGTLTGLDYRGEMVVAAYAPVPSLEVGFVAKMDLAEIRAPFLRSAFLTAGIALMIIAIGSGATIVSLGPLTRRVETQAMDLHVTNIELTREVAERQQAEEALATSARTLRLTLDAISDGSWEWNLVTGEVVFSDKWLDSLGFKREEITPHVSFWESLIHPDDRSATEEVLTAHLEGRTGSYTCENRLRKKSGDYRWNVDRGRVVERDPDGKPLRMVGADTDITEHKQAEELVAQQQRALEMNHRIANAFLASPAADTYAGVLDVILETLDSAFGYFGYIDDDGDLVCPAMTQNVWGGGEATDRGNVFPRDAWGGLWGQSLLEKRTLMANDGLEPPEGHVPLESALVVPIVHRDTLIGQFAVANRPGGYSEHDQDLLESAAKQTAPVLYARLEKGRQDQAHEMLEEQYRHAQRMEAVGQLAGGVAHDFNNLLQVIQGFGEIALLQAEQDGAVQAPIQEMLNASDRAKKLVAQLLAFSRRQVLEMKHVDLNDVIADLMDMIRPVIGEHVRLDIVPGYNLGIVRADRGQLEQVLMNLCVNARDAMPEGGTITVEVENVRIDEEYCESHSWATPGRYALLSVTDTGCGMDDETLKSIFEPFFTTKEPGEGTGLGLATVYGLVKQHGGMIHVYSEVGKGTTFKIYLPLTERSAADVGDKIEGPTPGGSETILVAEDDEMVLQLTKDVLEDAGYTVLTAVDGEKALSLFEKKADAIDLLLLDVVMPKLGGRVVFERIHKEHPEVRVLFASGYSMNAIHTNFVLDEGLTLLQKPHNRAELLRKVREVLDRE